MNRHNASASKKGKINCTKSNIQIKGKGGAHIAKNEIIFNCMMLMIFLKNLKYDLSGKEYFTSFSLSRLLLILFKILIYNVIN